MLVNGKWAKDFEPVQGKDKKGGFVRKDSSFRGWIGSEDHPAERGRYHLYAALICPWASRVLALKNLKGIDDAIIPVTIVEPSLTEQGWRFGDFPGASGADPILGATYMHEHYSLADNDYTGRATVPVLWDKGKNTIVNNESSELVKMLNSAFDELLPKDKRDMDLYPETLRAEIDTFNADIYPSINNGVYRAGFATTQEAYEEAYDILFDKLDEIEARFSDGRAFVHGDHVTLSDIHLFPTLIRFDVAYHGLFKTNKKRIADYECLSAYVARMMDIPEIANTVNIDHIKTGYYSIKALNPSGIVPKGPDQALFRYHINRPSA